MKFDLSQNWCLENTRVKLEPLKADHFDLLAPIAIKSPDLLKYSPPKFGTKESLQTYINSALDAKDKGLKYPYVVFDKASRE